MRLLNGLFLCATLLGSARAADLPTAQVRVGGSEFTVELALNDASRMRGLMFRDSMAADRGMLFVFQSTEQQSFWMRNTRIALDIMYFDNEGRLVSVSADTPPCKTASCPSYPSEGPARYVLELNAGKAKELGLTKGSPLCMVGQSQYELPACTK